MPREVAASRTTAPAPGPRIPASPKPGPAPRTTTKSQCTQTLCSNDTPRARCPNLTLKTGPGCQLTDGLTSRPDTAGIRGNDNFPGPEGRYSALQMDNKAAQK